jgi:integrase
VSESCSIWDTVGNSLRAAYLRIRRFPEYRVSVGASPLRGCSGLSRGKKVICWANPNEKGRNGRRVAVTERQTEAAPLRARDESGQGQRQAVLHSGAAIESSERGDSLARKRYQKGSVYLCGKNQMWYGRYRDDVISPDGKTSRVRRNVPLGSKRELPTKRLAERRMDAILARINGLDYRATRISTFEGFVARWKVEVLTRQQDSSARAVRSHLKCYIVPQLAKLRLEQFGPENQQTFISRVSENGVSRKTILNVLGTLSSILSTARDWGYNCEQIDVSKLRLPPREARYEAPHFTIEQLNKILAIAEEPWRTLYFILTMDGLRAGEVLGLQWRDIDLDGRLLHVRRSAWYGKVQTTKSKASETVLPIPQPLIDVLKEYRTQWKPNPQRFLFVTRNGRPPSSNKVVEYHLWTILDALGIPRCGLHAFRTRILRYFSTPGLPPRWFKHSYDTPMRAPRLRFMGTL